MSVLEIHQWCPHIPNHTHLWVTHLLLSILFLHNSMSIEIESNKSVTPKYLNIYFECADTDESQGLTSYFHIHSENARWAMLRLTDGRMQYSFPLLGYSNIGITPS